MEPYIFAPDDWVATAPPEIRDAWVAAYRLGVRLIRMASFAQHFSIFPSPWPPDDPLDPVWHFYELAKEAEALVVEQHGGQQIRAIERELYLRSAAAVPLHLRVLNSYLMLGNLQAYSWETGLKQLEWDDVRRRVIQRVDFGDELSFDDALRVETARLLEASRRTCWPGCPEHRQQDRRSC